MNIMKKLSLLLMSLLIVLSLSNCKKDNSNGGDGNGDDSSSGPKPVPVTENISSNASRPTANQETFIDVDKLLQPVKLLSATSTSTVEFTYDGRHITKVTSTEDNGDVTVQDFYYHDMAKGLLDSIVTTTNGAFDGKAEYTITNDQVTAIKNFDDTRTMTMQMTFSNYNSDGQPGNMGVTIVDPSGNIDFTGTSTFDGDDVTNLNLTGSYSGYPLTLTYSYVYDDKNAENLNVETILNPLGSVHNITEQHIVLSIMGSAMSTTDTQTTYTYNGDDYPTQSTTTETTVDSDGTSVTTTTTTITYEDK